MPKLYVVATPIGNLDDLTPRMRAALEAADLIAAEDTRVTMKLLNRFEMKKPMVSCHRHNEENRAPQLVARMLEENLTVALTCDAGTPGISDPGHLLVRAAWEAGIPVEPVSGPSAVVTCLSASGFDAREFAFYGFLPRENGDLRKKLHAIAHGSRVAVAYESPHRIVNLVEQIAREIPGARVCVCCDLTKKFEKIERGLAGTVLERLKANPNVEKGEYCVAIELPEIEEEAPAAQLSPRHMVMDALLEGMSMRDAVKCATQQGASRQDAYAASLEIKRWLESQLEE